MISKSEDINKTTELFDQVSRLQADLEECKRVAGENMAGWKRSRADYLNLQRDIERNKQSWADFAALGLIKELVPVWLAFEVIARNLPPDINEAWAKGLKQLGKMFGDFLKKQGVEQMETQGQTFDPIWHEAVGREKKDETDSNIIIREIAPGFKMNNKLIIPPKVIVAE